MADEGVLDPWIANWIEEDPNRAVPIIFTEDILPFARGEGGPPTRDIDSVVDDDVDGIPIRIYRNDAEPTGLVVYFHGGAFMIGSIGLMDNVARELCHGSGAVVVSVGYRLAPEDPYPAGLDDCDAVTRWSVANAVALGASADRVVVAGESAGGNLAAAVSLRLRDSGDVSLAGQLLIYPGTAGSKVSDSMLEFSGLILSLESMEYSWSAYAAGRDLDDDPYAAPLSAPSLVGLPPALVQLGGCDLLRDEGRAYARRMVDAGVAVEEITYSGQTHGFINMEFPAASTAFADAGQWIRGVFA